MALIQKIRSKGVLILVLMVLAIAGFLAMDIMKSGNRSGSNRVTSNVMGQVDGKTFTYEDFQQIEDVMYTNAKGDVRTQNHIFDEFVDGALVNQEADKLGMGVCKDELLGLEFGPNFSPEVSQNPVMSNTQTGQIDPDKVKQVREAFLQKNQQLETPEFKGYWSEFERRVIKTRLQEKLVALVSKGVYSPTWMVDAAYADLTQPVDILFVKAPFDAVKDDEVKLTDADYQAYLDQHKGKYNQDEETRKMDFVTFTVTPTSEDSNKIDNQIKTLIPDFQKSVKDSAFATLNGGLAPDQWLNSLTQGISEPMKKALFSAPVAVGAVIGPYIDQKSYWLAKIIDKRNGPDSVKARHILLQPKAQTDKIVDLEKMADSFRLALETGKANWDSLNLKYSSDKVAQAAKGELGMVANGAMVPKFNDLIFYKAAPGKYYTVTTQFGVHIVQVTGQSAKREDRLKVAFIRKPIVPGAETLKRVEDQANAFLAANRTLEALDKNAQTAGGQLQTTQPLRAYDYSLGTAGGGAPARDAIKWAYKEGSVGEVAPSVYAFSDQGDSYISRYVVAALKSIQPKGTPTVANIKDDLTPFVKNMKRGEILKNKITGNDLNAIAATYQTKIDTAMQLTFNAIYIPKVGQEPEVIAAAFSTPVNSVTKPIIGQSGVYVVKVISKNPIVNSPVDKNALRQQASAPLKNLIRGKLLADLKKNASITDNRSSFF